MAVAVIVKDCTKLIVKGKNGLTIISIGQTRGNKKALVTIIQVLGKVQAISKSDYNDIAPTYKIMKKTLALYKLQ